MNTCAPSATKHLAAPSPIPALPPVTTATLFVSFFSIALFLSLFLIERRERSKTTKGKELWKRNSRTKLPSLLEAAQVSDWALPSALLPKAHRYSLPGAVNRNWTRPLLRSVGTLPLFAETLPTWRI